MSSKDNADYLMQVAMNSGIQGHRELGNFMGQMQVESGGFSRMSENLNYSGERLLAVFPGRNGMDAIKKANEIAAGGPEAIANEIYGGRWGKVNLGNTEPGDGWKYHGRGFVQLTGRANYEQQNVTAACRDINGGTNGLVDRKTAAAAWGQKIAHGYVPGAAESPTHARTNSNQDNRHLQELLNQQGYRDASGHPLTVDGDYGARTRHAVEAFQREQHLKVDGVAGSNTLHRLEALTHAQTSAGHAAPTAPVHATPPRLNDPSHPDHALYQQALRGVHLLDAQQQQRTPDQQSENLAAALAMAARRDGMNRIDHVVLSDDGSRTFAVQGDTQSLFKQLAQVQTQPAVNTTVEQSSLALAQVAPKQPAPTLAPMYQEAGQQSANPIHMA